MCVVGDFVVVKMNDYADLYGRFRCLQSIYIVIIVFCKITSGVNILCFCGSFVIGLNIW